MNKGMIFKKKAADGLVAKYVVNYEVITSTIIDGDIKYTERQDIRKLGYANMNDYVTSLKERGFAPVTE